MLRSYRYLIVLALLVVPLAARAQGTPVPAVGLYWKCACDPTIGAGVSAPLNQLLIRTDTLGIYFKSGSANTAWSRIGIGGSGFPLMDGNKGDITVSGAGANWTINLAAVTLAKMANLAQSTVIGRASGAGTGTPTALTSAEVTALLDNFTSTLRGTAPASGGGTVNYLRADGAWAAPPVSDGNKGDITVSAGGTSWAINNGAVTLAKMANLAQSTFIGRVQGTGTGTPVAMTATQATAELDNFTSALRGTAPASGGGTANFLRADGSWASPPGAGIPDGNKGDITVSGSGTAWAINNGSVTLAKQANLAQATVIGRATGAGTGVPTALSTTDVTALINSFTSVLSGAAPASGGGTTNFLRADGSWASPPGGTTGSGTTNTMTKWTGTNTIGNSIITDDGTDVVDGVGLSSNSFNVGRLTNGITNAQNGWRVTTFGDGNNYIDSKTYSGGSTIFRTGEGTQTGANTTWLTLDSTDGSTTWAGPAVLSSSLNVGGNTTVGNFRGKTQADTSTGTADNFVVNDTTTILRFTPGTNLTVTGFKCGSRNCDATDDGRMLVLWNNGGALISVILNQEAAGSVAGNRIWGITNANTMLGSNAGSNPNTSAVLVYDGTSLRWRVVALNSSSVNITDFAQGVTFAATTAVSAAFSVSQGVTFSDTHSPTAISGSTNNYNPTGFSTTFALNQDVSSAATLTGLTAGVTGRLIVLINISTTAANTLTLTNEDASSTATNRFTLPNAASCVIPAGGGVTLRYTVNRWRLITPCPTAAAGTVTLAQMADLAQDTIIGRADAAGTGVPTALTASQVNTILPVATATVKGLVPTPPNNTTTFLRGDATWATVPGSTLQTAKLAGDVTNSSTAVAELADLTTSLAAGTYQFKYMMVYRDSDVGGGLVLSADFTGTSDFMVTNYIVVGTAGAGGSVANQNSVAAGTLSRSAASARAGIATGRVVVATVDTANQDMLCVVEGTIKVTGTGSLKLYQSLNTALGTLTLRTGSSLLITPI